jgi:hypothetical protein
MIISSTNTVTFGSNVIKFPQAREWFRSTFNFDITKPMTLRGGCSCCGSRSKKKDETISCLNYAAMAGDAAYFDFLVSLGADPNRSIALHFAAQNPDRGTTAAMMAHLVDRYGFDILAEEYCNGLRNTGHWEPGPWVISWAAHYDNPAAVRFLLDRGVGAENRGIARQALRIAVGKAHTASVMAFLDAGFEDPTVTLEDYFVDILRRANDWRTDQLIAVGGLLVEYGADVGKAREGFEARCGAEPPWPGRPERMERFSREYEDVGP